MKILIPLFISMFLTPKNNDNGLNDLHVQINNIPSSKGNIMIAVYDKETGFMEKEYTFRNAVIQAQQGSMEITIAQLPVQQYSIAVYHDANGNGKLDKNFFGVPTEYYGFSNNARGTFGPPSFGDCSFNLTTSKKITIDLK